MGFGAGRHYLTLKKFLPKVHLKAFTPVEIVHFGKISGLSISRVLEKLKAAGLDSLPGGGAEILDDRVRKLICPKKATTAEWIEVITTAHGLGLPTNAICNKCFDTIIGNKCNCDV